ncbi:MAG: hypothetical protein M5E90_07855 [Asgard group archaeon]|nr:hypothetical protein [Asgard group archaeon]
MDVVSSSNDLGKKSKISPDWSILWLSNNTTQFRSTCPYLFERSNNSI